MRFKSMKRWFVSIICICLFAGNVVYADKSVNNYTSKEKFQHLDEYPVLFEKEAELMHELGLFDGISTTEFVPGLDEPTNREQAFKMLTIALDWDVDMESVSEFEDVSSWAQPYVAKAIELGITNGIGNGKFGGSDPITLKQLNTLLLRIIGYDYKVAWQETGEYARREFGIQYLYQHENLVLNRDKLVGNIFMAIRNGEPVGKDYTLLEKFVYNHNEKEEFAINNYLILKNYKVNKNMTHDEVEVSAKIEDLAPYFNENDGTMEYIQETLQAIQVTPLVIAVIYNTGSMELVYDYPEYSDEFKSITYGCRFGTITITRGDENFYVESLTLDEQGYFTLYGVDIGESVNSEEFEESNSLIWQDGSFAYDTMYKTVMSEELDVKISLEYKYDYDEDLKRTEVLKRVEVIN